MGVSVPVNPRVLDVATKDVVLVDPDEPLHRVASIMGEGAHACVLVCDDRRPLGIISERDLVRTLAQILAGTAMLGGTARSLMTSPIVTVGGDEDVNVAAALLQHHRVRSLPVVDKDGHAVGLIRSTDVLQATITALARQRAGLEATVSTRTEELQRAHDALLLLSRRDALMGIGNRRSMELALEEAHLRATRYGRPYAVILGDVDNFKSYNDTYGHPAGDDVLRAVAESVRLGLRSIDRAFRYGGEEILVLLPETDAAGAAIVAERIRQAIASLAVPHRDGIDGIVTMSLGVACWDASNPAEAGDVLVSNADTALYRAKADGRNQMRCHGAEVAGQIVN